ncbi:hypothetical protein [Azospirillum palustre]
MFDRRGGGLHAHFPRSRLVRQDSSAPAAHHRQDRRQAGGVQALPSHPQPLLSRDARHGPRSSLPPTLPPPC